MTEAQKKYIITEGQMERIHRMILPITGLTKLVAKDRQSLMQAIRSRPYKSAGAVLDELDRLDDIYTKMIGVIVEREVDGMMTNEDHIKYEMICLCRSEVKERLKELRQKER